ncbi:MAG: AIR synthase family protein [Candidatus Nezhaarchaeales archaeon]
MTLISGKLHPDVLEKLVFTRLGVKDPRVLVGPKLGEDAAVIDMGDRVLVIHVDPITGAVKNVGWLAVNVSVNDVASRGAKPLWILISLFLREGASLEEAEAITTQINEAALQLGVSVVGGHTEVTPGLTRPIIVSVAVGEAPKNAYVTSSGARPGDAIVVTKGAAIEGTGILAYEFERELTVRLGEDVIERAKRYITMISVLKDAQIAISVRGVTAMHDATEGGVLGAIQEVAWASKVGVKVYEDRIPISPETKAICSLLGIDPLRTISSGTLIITVKPGKTEELVKQLNVNDVKASVVGEVTEPREGIKLYKSDGSVEDLLTPIREQLWTVMEKRLSIT